MSRENCSTPAYEPGEEGSYTPRYESFGGLGAIWGRGTWGPWCSKCTPATTATATAAASPRTFTATAIARLTRFIGHHIYNAPTIITARQECHRRNKARKHSRAQDHDEGPDTVLHHAP